MKVIHIYRTVPKNQKQKLMQYPYFGPKKTLKWMEQNHPIAFVHYKTALEDFSVDSLKKLDYIYKKMQMIHSDRFKLAYDNVQLLLK